jgi:energy-coupling factor transporter ATP-binding protein EcfA2
VKISKSVATCNGHFRASYNASCDPPKMIDVPRFALVIGSQCDTQPPLTFLPDLAEDLYGVLTDPNLGACVSALGQTTEGLLQNPTCEGVLDGLEKAFAIANEAGEPDGSSSMLFVALLGHGMADDDDFYFLAKDAKGSGSARHDVYLSQHLKELLRKNGNLYGLIVWLDTCQAGVGAKEAVDKWGNVGLGKDVRRYEVLTAADDRPAYRGDFTRTLIDTVRKGMPKAGETLDANDLRAVFQELPDQQPQRVTVDGGGWTFPGDSGLWISKNAVLRSLEDDAAGTIAVANASDLTNFLQPTTTLDELVAASAKNRCVVLTGPRGAGKSTTAAALAKPASSDEHVPDGFVQAIAFGRHDIQGPTVASMLAGQLRVNVEGFARAVNEFDKSLDPGEREGWSAVDRRILGPLGLMKLEHPVRLVIDGFDELPRETQETLRASISTTLRRAEEEADSTDICFVLTARPGAHFPAGAVAVELRNPAGDAISAYFRQRGISDEKLPALVDSAAGNWLHARLIADLAVRTDFRWDYLSTGLAPTLAKLYDGELQAAGAGDPATWRNILRPVLAVCAAAGVGPVLPLPLSKAAAAHLGLTPHTSMTFRDALVMLSGLVVRSRPGQARERVGVFHGSLIGEYLSREGVTDYAIDLADAHGAIVQALDELAPADEHDPDDQLHRYAMVAEPDHIWSSGDVSGVVDSLIKRRLNRASDERERWQHWKTRLEERLGGAAETTVTARENLARWTGEAGEPKQARDLLREVLPIREQMSGPVSRKTLTTRGRLAYFTAKVGFLVEARDQYRELLDLYMRHFGSSDLSTLETWMNYARFTGEAGDPTRAREELGMLVSLCTDRCGEEDGRTVAIRENLARFTGEAGDPAAARDQYRDVLPLRQSLSGHTDPDTLITRSNFAYFTGEAGDPVSARDQYRELLPLREQIGVKHPDTLTTRANLARFIGEAGDPVAALDELTDLVALRQNVSGRQHPDTLTTWEILARFTAQLGEPATAQDVLGKLLPLRERISGGDHPDTIATRTNLACFTAMTAEPIGTYDRAEGATELTDVSAMAQREPATEDPHAEARQTPGDSPVASHKRRSAPEHPDTLTIRAPLAHMNALVRAPVLNDQAARDQLAATCSLLRMLLLDRERVSGENHPDTLTTRENVAYFIGVAGDPAAARDELNAVLPPRAEVSGENHPDTLTARGNLAYFTGMSGDRLAAEHQLRRLLPIREKISGEHHPDTVAVRRSLAYWAEAPDQGGSKQDMGLRQ